MDQPVSASPFAQDVREGLSATPKRLSSRYFYDARGDRIFQRIMASPEYYLTDCELEILRGQGDDIATTISGGAPIELVELGSGDGQKIAFLLDALQECCPGFVYRPVDISRHSLELLTRRLAPGREWLNLQAQHANYVDWLAGLEPGTRPRCFAFLGSNLGNFGHQGSVTFLRKVRAAMRQRDSLLIGLDLKKDPAVILPAYNDAGGHTREFNLNLLRRINRELEANFDLDGFRHAPEYDPVTGAARSFLVSRRAQEVRVGALGTTFRFAEGEKVFMEVSQKYDEAMIEEIAGESGFRVSRAFYDSRGWFTDQVWRPVAASPPD